MNESGVSNPATLQCFIHLTLCRISAIKPCLVVPCETTLAAVDMLRCLCTVFFAGKKLECKVVACF